MCIPAYQFPLDCQSNYNEYGVTAATSCEEIMPDTDYDILVRARDLIREGAFSEARNLLYSIQHNEKAQDWLQKLDRIAPDNTDVAEPLPFDEINLEVEFTALPFDALAQSGADKLPFEEEIYAFDVPAQAVESQQQWQHCRLEFNGEKIDITNFPEDTTYVEYIKELVRKRTVTGALRSRAVPKVYPELLEKLGDDGWQAMSYTEEEGRIIWVFKRPLP